MTRPLAIEFISALGMPPDEMVALVADLGLTRFGLAPRPITLNAAAFRTWDLLQDTALRDRTRAAMRRYGVSLAIGEGFLVRPDDTADTHLAALDLMADLGAPRINAVNLGGRGAPAIEAFGRLGMEARSRGMRTTIEFLPMMAPATFADALTFAGDAGIEVLVDAMHFFRSGGRIEELTRADPSMIGHAQVCDVPLPAITQDYGREASQDRLPPGEGDLPLQGFIRALPPHVTVGLELPMMSRADAMTDIQALLAPAVAAMRQLVG